MKMKDLDKYVLFLLYSYSSEDIEYCQNIECDTFDRKWNRPVKEPLRIYAYSDETCMAVMLRFNSNLKKIQDTLHVDNL